jgi:hypothetical protein
LNPDRVVLLHDTKSEGDGSKMKQVILLTLLLVAAVIPACTDISPVTPPWPPEHPVAQQPPDVDPEIVESIRSLLWYCGSDWNYSVFDHDTLWGGLDALYREGISTDNYHLATVALNVMGRSGIVEFTPAILSALEFYPFDACLALGGMPGEYAVYALIQYLDHPYVSVRLAVVLGLKNWNFYREHPIAYGQVQYYLRWRLAAEPDEFVREQIEEALVTIQETVGF